MADVSEYHGQIKCATISVSDLNRSLALYRDYLGYTLVEAAELDDDLAIAWSVKKMLAAPYAILQPASGADCFLRLIQVPTYNDFKPARTYGWSAFEICVSDVFNLAERISDSDFTIVGPPKLVDGFTSFIPMQVVGPDGEILFLNQVNHSDEDVDLPIAQSAVDKIFIVVLASPNRERSATEYQWDLCLDRAATHSLSYTLLNRAFDLPMDTKQSITMIQNGRMPIAQIDQYPAEATSRPKHDGCLPPGNSMVTLMVDDLDALSIEDKMTASPAVREGVFYRGRRTVLIKGSASELIELIEIA